jgi:hypothetical protein
MNHTIGVGETLCRNGQPVSYNRTGVGDAGDALAPASQRLAAKIASVAVGTLTIGVLGTLVGAGISLLDTKKLRPAMVGNGAMVGAALGGMLGLFTEVSVRPAPAKATVSP